MTSACFASFRLDLANEQLWAGDARLPLRGKTFAVLRYLVERPGELVTKAALLDAVWADAAVSDSMPSICVTELRKALGDDARQPGIIETVHGRGYRFIASVTVPAVEAPDSPSPPWGRAPFVVGREAELAQLDAWFAKVVATGARNVVFVWGEPGIGKTAFARAFITSLRDKTAVRIAYGQCVEQYGAGEPYMPMLEALSRLCQAANGGQVHATLRRLAPSWLAQMPSLLSEAERADLVSLTQGLTQPRMLSEMTGALAALAAETPLVLLLEDLHWSDPSTLELIAAVGQQAEASQLLIIGTYRPAEMLAPGHPLRRVKGELELHHQCGEIRLRLLNESDIADYLAKRLGDGSDAGLFSGLAATLHARTEGNPLFIVDLVDFLVAHGTLMRSGGAFAAKPPRPPDLGRIDIPRSIIQMVERNLDQLDANDQHVLEAASVAGDHFSVAAVAAGLECSPDAIEACCTRLARREQFIGTAGLNQWPDGTASASFRFNHALYREVLYERAPAGQRMELHRRIADCEESAYGEQAGTIAAELADHYARGNDPAKAVKYLQLAGELASSRGALVEAERHYSHALELLVSLPEGLDRLRQELRLQLAVGPALIAVKGFAAPETERAYARALELCERLGDLPEVYPALFGMWVMHFLRGEFSKAYRLAEQLLRQAKISSGLTLPLAELAVGNASYQMGKLSQAREHIEQALLHYDPDRHGPATMRDMGFDARISGLSAIALTLWHLGYPDQALARANEGVALARGLAHLHSVAHAEFFVGFVRQWRREPGATLASADAVIALSTEQGFALWLGWATTLRGCAMAEDGHRAEGITQIEEGLAMSLATGTKLSRSDFLCVLAEACIATGRFDAGRRALEEALAAADQHEGRLCEAEVHRLKGELLLQQHRFERNGVVHPGEASATSSRFCKVPIRTR